MSKPVQLSAKWQLDAALLSRPVDLTPLVTLSKTHPEEFFRDDSIHRMVTSLLNEQNESKSDRDTKLDVITILANISLSTDESAKPQVRMALQAVSEWFDEHLQAEDNPNTEPELHKAMTLLLARAWEYKLKTEDILELTGGNRLLALETIVSLLEDGETYSTELKQRRKPGQGQLAQWEHELVCHRYEKPLILQICRLIRGFTHPMTYFSCGTQNMELHSVEQFSAEIDKLLDTTLRSRLVEKISVALHDCIFDPSSNLKLMSEHDHLAIVSVNTFLQNLYFYAMGRNDEYRRHLLSDTLLIPRLILPYVEQCVTHALIFERRAEESVTQEDEVIGLSLDAPAVVKGIAASLRTLVIATFRAPTTRFVIELLKKFNPTLGILKAAAFISKNDYLFALLCVLNINMGALDLSSHEAQWHEEGESNDSSSETMEANVYVHTLLHQLAQVFVQMTRETQVRVARRVMFSSALPVARDTPSYLAIMSILHGGAAGQLDYVKGGRFRQSEEEDDEADQFDVRAAAKKEAQDRLDHLKSSKSASKQSVQFHHLADLPDLHAHKAYLVLDLELPTEVNRKRPMLADAKSPSGRRREITPDDDHDTAIPTEFKCAINGHVLKEPVRSPHGHVFERSTIELWLQTRGSVCPISHLPLTMEQLVPAGDLKAQIMRWHIQKTTIQPTTIAMPSPNDDLYDF